MFIQQNSILIMLKISVLCFASGFVLTYIFTKLHNLYSEADVEYNLGHVKYVVIILSRVNGEVKRDTIRNTWFNFAKNLFMYNHKQYVKWRLNANGTIKKSRRDIEPNEVEPNEGEPNEVKPKVERKSLEDECRLIEINHWVGFYFVIGTRYLNKTQLMRLEKENKLNKDLLLLRAIDDRYKSLTDKILHSIVWAGKNLHDVQYLIKCDDDSFVRVDLIIRDLILYAPWMEAPVLREFVTYKDSKKTYTGLYWGYFTGDAEIQSIGRWQEGNWFLCDRYAPYALGGGYVISRSVIKYIASNSDMLSRYNCEDASMGVWTAALNIKRVHDIRFETGYRIRRCDSNTFVRHNASTDDIVEMYSSLLASGGETMCHEQFRDMSYWYLWGREPSKCCKAWIW